MNSYSYLISLIILLIFNNILLADISKLYNLGLNLRYLNSFIGKSESKEIFELLPDLDEARSALIKAIKKKDISEVKYLLDRGAPVNPGKVKEKMDQIPLAVAINSKDLNIIKLLLARNADVNIGWGEPGSHERLSILSKALETKSEDIIKAILNTKKVDANISVSYVGQDLNWIGGRSAPILNYAIANYFSLHIIEMLINSGADVNGFDYINSWSPLMVAAYLREKDIVDLLIKHDADIKLENSDYKTACDSLNLDLTNDLSDIKPKNVDKSTFEYLKKLLCFPASESASNLLEDVILAVKAEDFEKVKYLIGKKAPVNPLHEMFSGNFDFNKTPLALAVEAKNYDIAKFLVDNGADINKIINLENKKGFPIIALAIDMNSSKFINLLLNGKIKANVNQIVPVGNLELEKLNPDSESNLPLLSYAILKNVDVEPMLRYLVSAGADVNKFPYDSPQIWSPLLLATALNRVDVIDFLLKNNADIKLKNDEGKNACDLLDQKKLGADVYKRLRSLLCTK